MNTSFKVTKRKCDICSEYISLYGNSKLKDYIFRIKRLFGFLPFFYIKKYICNSCCVHFNNRYDELSKKVKFKISWWDYDPFWMGVSHVKIMTVKFKELKK